MHDYFYNIFPQQLRSLEFHKPNQIVREHIMRDNTVVFFGGQDWKTVSDDLSHIPLKDRPHFILSLFMMALTDQYLYTYKPNAYQLWREKTNFPKFGWSGFGSHNENPLKLLWAPEKENAINTDEVLGLMPHFVNFLTEETNTYFRKNLPDIDFDLENYLQRIKNDSAYLFNDGQIVQCFKSEFEDLTRRSSGSASPSTELQR